MNYNVSLEVKKEIAASRSSKALAAVERDRGREGLAYLKPGQRITGTVVSVDKQVTLDFDGHRVTTSKDLLKYAVPGDKKTFEVIKATVSEIELKLLEESVKAFNQTIKAITVKERIGRLFLQKRSRRQRRRKKKKRHKKQLINWKKSVLNSRNRIMWHWSRKASRQRACRSMAYIPQSTE